MNNKEFLYITLKNFFTYGLFVALTLTLLELINKNINYVGFFAFLSASFFIVNLIQYYIIDKTNPKASKTFLIHTILGGLAWVLYALLMYVIYLNKFTTTQNIFILLFAIISVTFLYYIIFIR